MERGIVPPNAAIMAGLIAPAHVVKDVSVWFQRQEPMCTALWNENRIQQACVQDRRDPAPVAGATCSKINRHIKNAATDNMHEFRFRMRRRLKVHATQGPD
jgi:hypothetical protein